MSNVEPVLPVNKTNFYTPNISLFRLNQDGSVPSLDAGFATLNKPGLRSDSNLLNFLTIFHRHILAYAPMGGSKIADIGLHPEGSRFPDGPSSRVAVDRISH